MYSNPSTANIQSQYGIYRSISQQPIKCDSYSQVRLEAIYIALLLLRKMLIKNNLGKQKTMKQKNSNYVLELSI